MLKGKLKFPLHDLSVPPYVMWYYITNYQKVFFFRVMQNESSFLLLAVMPAILQVIFIGAKEHAESSLAQQQQRQLAKKSGVKCT